MSYNPSDGGIESGERVRRDDKDLIVGEDGTLYDPADEDPEHQRPYTFATDHDGDILFDDLNRPVIVDGTQCLKQDLLVSCASYKGDDPFDPEIGLDVFQLVGKTPQHVKAEIARLLNYDDYRHSRVQTVLEVRTETDRATRTTSVHATVQFVTGAVEELSLTAPTPRV